MKLTHKQLLQIIQEEIDAVKNKPSFTREETQAIAKMIMSSSKRIGEIYNLLYGGGKPGPGYVSSGLWEALEEACADGDEEACNDKAVFQTKINDLVKQKILKIEDWDFPEYPGEKVYGQATGPDGLTRMAL